MKQGGSRVARWLPVRSDSARSGFTIVETLIVLAVTSGLFFMAAAFINGQQRKTEFMTGINDLQQTLQQIMNETASGFYPNNGGFACQQGNSTAPGFIDGSNSQGTNKDCLFLGRAVQFGTATDPSQLGIIPIVGNRQLSGNTVLTIPDSYPRALYPGSDETSSYSQAVFDALQSTAQTKTMEQGLTVASKNNTGCPGINYGMCYSSAGGCGTPPSAVGAPKKTGILAFIAGDGCGTIASNDSGTSNLATGGQQITLYSVNSPGQSVINQNLDNTTKAIDGYNGGSRLIAADSASICIANSPTNQSGLFTITSGLQVTLKIMNGTTC